MWVHLIDKPTGITSFDVIRQLRRQWYPRKMWHAGTLDPLASGLLIVCSEKDTKRISEFMWLDKIYQTTIDLSLATDTRDTDKREREEKYQVVSHGQRVGIEKEGTFVPAPTEEEIVASFTSIRGTHDLPLTPFSAKKVDGKKLYEYARNGNPLFMDVPMTVHNFTITSYQFPLLTMECEVGKGTYIRSLAHWIGQQFWLGGTVTMLRRTHIGHHSVEDAERLTLQKNSDR